MDYAKYPRLFSPIRIGSMTVKNRIFMSAIGTHLASGNYEVTDALLAFYEARARGGVGMMTTEAIMVAANSRYATFHNLGLFEDRMISEMEKLTAVAHRYDMRLCAQLMHPSSMATAFYNGGIQPIAPSAIENGSSGALPREATREELRILTRRFGEAAGRAKAAGFDAVELHCCHGHGLLGKFISPLDNKRTDEYGGNLDGRLKLPLDVIAEVRNAVGPEFPISVRMTAVEDLPGGQSLMEACYIAWQFEKAGVSMINMSFGVLDTPWKTTAPAGTAKGFNTEYAGELKKAVTIPVGFVGRVNEPWIAEMSIEMGKGDVVYMGRALIADPDFPVKTLEGRESEICPCIGCNHCICCINSDQQISCSMNPLAGHESEWDGQTAETPQKILVVGGGPAGMTAAAMAAEKGYQVILAEEDSRLGGQMLLAAFPPCKQDIAAGTRYMAERCERAGVEIRLNTKMDIAAIRAEKVAGVILASGGKPTLPETLKDATQLVSAWDILSGRVKASGNTVIVGGGQVGSETADFLLPAVADMKADRRKVTLIASREVVAHDEKSSARTLLVRRLLEKGCTIITSARVMSAFGKDLVYRQGGKEYTISNVDTVVSAVGIKKDDMLASQLDAAGINYVAIGDVVGGGNIASATAGAMDAVKKWNVSNG